MNEAATIVAPKMANALGAVRHVFVRDLELKALVGIHDHEKIAPQRIIINVDLMADESEPVNDDVFRTVVDYERVVKKIKQIIEEGHVNLLETLAERFAERCLEDPRVLSARIRIEKPDVMPEAASVGIEIERVRAKS
jgi:dihydroneopterin aldolase